MEIKSTFFIMLLACMVFTICFIMIRSKGASVYALMTKAMASFCFIALFIVSITYEKVFLSQYIGLGLGLVLGLIGDILLDLKVVYKEHENEYLVGGFISFGLGHICYILSMIGFVTTGWAVSSIWLAVGISAGVAVLLTLGVYYTSNIMKNDFGKHTIITMVYTFILMFTTVFAVVLAIMNANFWSLAIGFVLFTVSDLILSMQYFGGKADNNLLQVLNHSCYYLAQIVIASTLFIEILL